MQKNHVVLVKDFNMQNIELITPAELSEKLKIKNSTVTNWVKNKKIPELLYVKIGTIVRIHKDKFENFYKINLNDLITVKEAAKILRTNENTLKSWLLRKQLPENIKCNIVGVARIKKSLLVHFITGNNGNVAA